MAAMRGRMRKEIAMLESDPPFAFAVDRVIFRSVGVSAWPKDDKIDQLEAQILGPDGSPYEKGVFQLEIEIPERYPFEPPKVRFLTPIYHPNIDDGGRICLDTLKMQPKGSWLPSVNISTLLTTIRLLMAEPNADDGLMPDIADVFKHNRELFNQKATEMTAQHARGTEAHAVKATHETKLEPDDGPCSHEEKEEDCADPPTQETEGPSQHEESVSSDDSFSDGNSSSENENGSTSDFDKNDEEKPPSKRRRQE